MTDARIEMPEDWDDHAGWERYYSFAIQSDRSDAPYLYHSEAVRFAGWIETRGYRRLWFPGCGLDGAPRIYASLGNDVLASDVSPSAVAFQRDLAAQAFDALSPDLVESLQRYAPDLTAGRAGTLAALQHDFREPLGEDGFDCLLNIRSYQALPPPSLQRAARIFFRALRPGGHAFFDTQNVQGERRERLEDALLEAGFAIPGYEQERSLRRGIEATGIPHLFVLGRPFVDRTNLRYQGGRGKKAADNDQKRLRDAHDAHQQRAEVANEEIIRLYDDPSVTTAAVVYNTG